MINQFVKNGPGVSIMAIKKADETTSYQFVVPSARLFPVGLHSVGTYF